MFLRLFVATLCIAAAGAFPSGPGSCNAPNPLGGSHLTTASSGALSKYGIVLKIGSKPVSPTTVFSLKAGTSSVISLSSTKAFKGFLIRISKGTTNTVGYLKKGSANTQVLNLCTSAKVGGISHNNNSAKKLIKGSIRIPTVGTGFKLHVTVVVQNSLGTSVWYTSVYTLKAVPATTRALRLGTGALDESPDSFPDEATVTLEDMSSVDMEDLALGDRVLVADHEAVF